MTTPVASPVVAVAPAVAVFDSAVLADMFGQDTAVIAEVLQTFQASMATSMDDLRGAIAGRDLAAAAGLAHRVKGAARMSGALALAQAALYLEESARQGDWQAAQMAALVVERQWQLVGRALSADTGS